MKAFRARIVLGGLAVAAVVVACGGGGGGTETAGPPLDSGKLDPAFGTSGRVLISGTPSGLALAPDGTAYIAGDSLIRIDPAGKATTFLGPLGPSVFQDPVLDESGNLFVLYAPDRHTYHVAKIDPSGQFVASYGANGVATLPFDQTKSTPGWLARDGQGNVYALGNVLSNGVTNILIARLDANGRQVPSFGTNGLKTFTVGARSTRGQAIVTDRDGTILVAGWLDEGSVDQAPMVARLDSNGNPVTTFGTGGAWTASGCSGYAFAIALDPASNIFVTATCRGGVLFKVDASGRTVESFRDAGLRGDLLGPGSTPRAVTVRSNGEIFVGGYSTAPACTDFVVAKLDSRGDPVAAFGSAGLVKFDVEEDLITELAFDAEGRLYAAGATGDCHGPHSQTRAFVVYRLGP